MNVPVISSYPIPTTSGTQNHHRPVNHTSLSTYFKPFSRNINTLAIIPKSFADLKGYIGVQPTKLYGSGTFKLAPKSTTTSGSTTLYGHYVHPKAELGLSVNVSSYGSFSISGGSNYDERGSQKTISW